MYVWIVFDEYGDSRIVTEEPTDLSWRLSHDSGVRNGVRHLVTVRDGVLCFDPADENGDV